MGSVDDLTDQILSTPFNLPTLIRFTGAVEQHFASIAPGVALVVHMGFQYAAFDLRLVDLLDDRLRLLFGFDLNQTVILDGPAPGVDDFEDFRSRNSDATSYEEW